MKKIITFLLLFPLTTLAAVTFDATSGGETDHVPTNDITGISTTHTAAGSDRYAVACVSTRYSGGGSLPTSMSCTYDGAAMTSQGQVAGSNVSAVQMFTKDDPSTTAGATVSCSWSNSQSYAVIGVSTFAGVTVGVGTPQTFNSGSSASPSVTVSSNSSNMVQDCLATSGGKPATATQTQTWNHDVAGSDAGIGAGERATGADSVNMGWSLAAADQVNLIAIDIRSVTPGSLAGWFKFFFGFGAW